MIFNRDDTELTGAANASKSRRVLIAGREEQSPRDDRIKHAEGEQAAKLPSTTLASSIQNSRNDLPPQTASPDGRNIQSDLIGRTFPVAASVDRACKETFQEVCDRLKEDLAKMASEPRDSAWATDMEAKLRQYVMSSGPSAFNVDNIECRTSWCAMEVSSPYGSVVGSIPYSNMLSNEMRMWDDSWGYETDQLGEKFTITLSVYKRL
jgi:hypothetical protein